MSTWSTYQQNVFKRYHSDKHFSEFLPTKWRQKSTGIDMELNYVTVTPCICNRLTGSELVVSHNYFLPTAHHFAAVAAGWTRWRHATSRFPPAVTIHSVLIIWRFVPRFWYVQQAICTPAAVYCISQPVVGQWMQRIGKVKGNKLKHFS